MKTGDTKARAPRKRSASVTKPGDWTEEQKQQIAEMAYQRFLARGGQHGYAFEDWLQAEAEFAASLASSKPKTARRAKA